MRILLLFICFGVVFSGCKNEASPIFSSTQKTKEKITIEFPDWPEKNYPVLSGYSVLIISAETKEEFFQPANIIETTKSVPVNEPLSIVARPITLSEDGKTQTIFFKPCGAVYPSKSGKNLKLSYEEGFTAYLLEQYFLTAKQNGNKIEEIKEFAEKFNWQKITEKIINETENEETFYNPWNTNIKKILLQICSKTFSATSLNLSNSAIFTFDEIFNQNENVFSVFLISSYLPETDFINEKKKINLKIESANLFLNNEIIYNIYVEKSKKMSLKTEFMPIYINGEP